MAQIKNEYGLTPAQERFCHEVVRGEYSSDGKGVLVTAYRNAYNCKSENGKARKSQYENASRLASNSKIKARIEMLKKEREELLTISHSEFVSRDVWLNDLDILELFKFDEKTGGWRLRRIYEMPKDIRKNVPFKLDAKGRMIPDLDKDKVRERLMKALGFGTERKDVNINGLFGGENVFEIGFDYDDEDEDD